MKARITPEILAPAGNRESFMAAVNAGADAVYLGVGTFNARAKADNFTKEELLEVVRTAHLYGVKVYLTLNTLIKNEEIQEVMDFVREAVNAKVDAFILQDLGIAMLIKKNFSGVVLHASTQMGVHNAMGARVLKKLGFSRVVLSRETTLEDIKAIAKEGLEIEYFVQGALCVAFSGNCYMSANALDKSGNRGLCAQLCRLEYTAACNGKTVGRSHYLSAADLCLIEKAEELIEAGVSSFKIEGRLRRAGYVAEAVVAYKNAVSAIPNVSESKERLSVAYSRGVYNEGEYLSAKVPKRIIEDKLYNHSGKFIGKVESCTPFKNIYELIIKSSQEINVQDGIKFFEGTKEVGSIGVGSVTPLGKDLYKVHTSTFVNKGATVNIISDAKREGELLAMKKQLPVTLNVRANPNEKLVMEAFFGDVSVRYVGDVIQPAKNAPVTKEDIADACRKTGGSAFRMEEVNVECDNVFIPKSVLNAARREVLNLLEEAIICQSEKGLADNKTNKTLCYELSVSACPSDDYVCREDIEIINIDNWNAENVKKQCNLCKKTDKKIVVSLPIICNFRDILMVREAIVAVKNDIYGVIANNYWALGLIENGFRVLAGFGLNVYNKQTLYALRAIGVKEVFASEESEIFEFCGEKGVFPSQKADIPLMTLAHCPVQAVFGNTCESCKYTPDFTYSDGRRRYKIKRIKLTRCYFSIFLDN